MQNLPPDTTRAYSSRYPLPTTMPLPVKHYDEVTSLEYGLLKIPYELLNRKFRTTLKRLQRSDFVISGICADIKKALPPVNEPIPLEKVADKLQLLVKKLHEFNKALQETVNGEIECASNFKKRTAYLNQAINGNVQDTDYYCRQRVIRLMIDHLLRIGYFETAQKLAEQAGTEEFTNIEVFTVAKQVEESLRQKDLSLCHQWILDNKSKLHRLNSTFEKEIHVQSVVELVKAGKKMESLEYAKKRYSLLHESQWAGTVQTSVMLFGGGAEIFGGPYEKLTSDERWNDLIEMFRAENAKIFNICEQSPFSVCVQLGIAAHKTPHCKEDPKSRCIVCKDLFEMALGLPYSHISISRLICPFKGELINEANVPLMLPNGQIYGENAIHELTKGDEVLDPKSEDFFNLRDVKRVFIL